MEIESKPLAASVLLWLLTLLCVAWAVATTIEGSFLYSTTYDEPFHRDWNTRFLEQGITERESVYNYSSTTPILIPNIAFAKIFAPKFPSISPLFFQRLPMSLWLVVLFVAVFLLGRRISRSTEGGLLAVLLLSLEPNISAHSSLITTDIPFAAALTFFLYSLLRLLEKLSPYWSVWAGFWLGLAFTAKFTATFALPFAFLAVIVAWRNSLFTLRFWGKALLSGAIVGGVSVLVICSFYGWVGVGTRLADFHFFNPSFSRFQSLLSWLPVPLPYDFVSGFDHLSMAAQRDQWNNIVLGRWYGQGVWFYHLVSLALKTPLALLLASFLGVALFFVGTKQGAERKVEGIFLLLVALGLFVHFSLFVKVQVGYRYVLMTLPLFAVVAAVGLAKGNRGSFSYFLLLGSLIFFSAVELAPYQTNRLSFTNSLLQPKKDAYLYLADSNIDWGQNRERRATAFQETGLSHVPLNPHHLMPGFNIFPINYLEGVFWNFDQHKWVREHLKPLTHFFHTELLFYASKEQFSQFLEDTRALTLLPSPPPSETSVFFEGGPQEFHFSKGEPQTIIRVSAERRSTLVISVPDGYVQLGPIDQSNACRFETLSRTEQAWYLLPEKGDYWICLSSLDRTATVKMSFRKEKSPER
ncbi:MAG: glycosyltransferase family 39 protein [Bdellovibrionales bacterium]|nr:glycosyltransferase family 39 protein [Bdellovibrionales bacterium]